ncbi:short chain dehydrogenase [Usnea florida]
MSQTKYTSKLHDAHVLIFGGTSGIGFCVAEAAIEHGAHVCICGSKQVKLEKAVSRLQSSYPDSASKVVGHICDLSQPDAIEHNIEIVLKFASVDSKIDHIVFTSGDALQVRPIAEATIESILKAGNVRFMGPLMLGKLAPKYMSAGPKSSITLTGGSMSHKPAKGWTVIAAWGSGREGMTRGLAVDLAPIRVNMVSPGAVHTELFDDIPKERLESVLQGYRDGTLVNQVGTPENLAEAYVYAMKDQFVTGKILESDGGRLLK